MMTNKVNLLHIFVLWTVTSLAQGEFKLVILHTNDMHSRFEETNAHSGQCVKGRGPCYGGFARLKTVVDQERDKAKAEGYKSIFLNAGDTYQGTVLFTMFKWEIVSELINMLGLDVISLGNHEFDDGPQGLAPFLANSTVPVVCSNIDYSKEPFLASDKHITKFSRSYVLNVDGVKIGVIGYITPETKFLSQTGAVTFENEVPAIKKEAEKLKSDGVKILIALGHAGYKTDMLIAEQVPDIDVVVGGHTNTFLYNGKAPDIEKIEGPYPTVVKQASGRKVPVVQAYAYTKYLGHLRLTFDDNGEVRESNGNPLLINESFKKDGAVERAVLKFANQVKEKAGKKIGSSKTFLEADDKTCRLRECNFGNLISDAMVDLNAQDFIGNGWTDAPIAFVQGGSLRASISTEVSGGDITFGNLLTTLPFKNSVERLLITGEVLKKALEHSVDRYDVHERVGGFLQFSGVHVEYDLSRSPGQRVVSAMVRCGDCTVPQYQPLDPTKQYRVLTNTFLADGGDDFTMLKEASERTVLSFSDVDAVLKYLNKRSPVHPGIEGRIILRGVPSSASSRTHGATLACLGVLYTLTAYILHS